MNLFDHFKGQDSEEEYSPAVKAVRDAKAAELDEKSRINRMKRYFRKENPVDEVEEIASFEEPEIESTEPKPTIKSCIKTGIACTKEGILNKGKKIREYWESIGDAPVMQPTYIAIEPEAVHDEETREKVQETLSNSSKQKIPVTSNSLSEKKARKSRLKILQGAVYKHANAHMISFIASDAPGFENWKEASIDSKPLELYDINGKKLFYQFSVYKNNNLIGRINVCADKTLGASVNNIELDSKPFKEPEAIKKSIEIAKNRYPTGEIKSTNMCIYSYPSIGAITVVKDKTTGKEYRIFVDAYTLDEVEDKPATETKPGVWSMYDRLLKNGKDNNLKEWKKSDQLTNSIEQAASNKGVNTDEVITDENMKKLRTDTATKLITGKNLSVPLYGQETSYYCGPASCQMIGKYICNIYRTQNYIYDFQGWHDHNNPAGGLSVSDVEDYCSYSQQSGGLGQSSTDSSTSMSFTVAKNEINNYRPFFTLTTSPPHYRVCYGYGDTGVGIYYIYINDPLPVGSGHKTVEVNGAQESIRIYVRP